jgi:UDP-N-acetylmuramoyl-tripeptide--D-alanyl-D-alanine ligase
VRPKELRQIIASEKIFKAHKGEKIAIVGSYGKTSMKELLLTVLSTGQKVAATPANKNVAVSHAAFARTLTGDENILLIEYGEGAPGDVAKFARITHPDRAIITGVAAAHLDRYKTTERAGRDIFSVAKYIKDKKHIYVTSESRAASSFLQPNYEPYGLTGTLGWKVENVKITITGLSFDMVRNKQKLRLRSGLLGRHNIGPLSLAVALAHEFGVDDQAVESAVAQTKPYEHRMQPYQLNGAWVIDDTYNGNIEGIRAGTALLKELPAARKIYVTPGLVDQGKESRQIHEEMGRMIADSGANVVVLMQNSTTDYIRTGLEMAGYDNELIIENDPLLFYTNLDKFVAAGDIALLQNDWPDNYS